MKAISDNKQNSFSRLFVLTVILLVMAGIVLRISGLGRLLAYDEIWTVCHYISLPWYKIFSDLATPNNHCLNSFLIQRCMDLFGSSAIVIRIPALIAGLLTVWLSISWVKNKVRGSWPLVMTASWVSLHAFLVYYSCTARGYSIQVFFVLAFFLLLLDQRKERHPHRAAILLFLFAVGACLSVTSGILFIGAFGAAYLLCLFPWRKFRSDRKGQLPFLSAGCLFLLLAVLWYGSFYTKLKEGQQFGVEIHSPYELICFCGQTLRGLSLYPLVFLTVIGACIRDRNPFRPACLFMLTACCLILLSSLVTKAGPERVYLAMYVPFVITGAMTISLICGKMKYKRISFLLCLLFTAMPLFSVTSDLNALETPCCDSIAGVLMADTPKNILIVFSRGDGIPVMFNCPDSIPDMRERLSKPLSGLLSAGNPSCLETMDNEGRDVNVPMDALFCKILPARNGIPLVQYALEPLLDHDDLSGTYLLVALSSVSVAESHFIHHELQQELSLRLNPVFSGALSNNGFLITNAFLCRNPQRSPADYLRISHVCGNRVRFFRFIKKSERE